MAASWTFIHAERPPEGLDFWLWTPGMASPTRFSYKAGLERVWPLAAQWMPADEGGRPFAPDPGLRPPPAPWRVEELSDEFFLRTNHKYLIRSSDDRMVAKVEGMGVISKATAQAICDAVNAANPPT